MSLGMNNSLFRILSPYELSRGPEGRQAGRHVVALPCERRLGEDGRSFFFLPPQIFMFPSVLSCRRIGETRNANSYHNV